jgi:hypothetical protein
MVLLSLQYFLGSNGAGWLDNWLPLSILAVMVAIIIHVIILMFARAFFIKELENYAMSEILQAVATAFMAIFLVVMVSSALGIAGNLIAGSVNCGGQTITIQNSSAHPDYSQIGTINIQQGEQGTMDQAFAVIRCRLQTRAAEVNDIQQQILNGAGGDFAALNLAMSLFGITFFKGDWIGSLYKKTETMRITNNLATVMIIGLNAQSALVNYLQNNMLSVFIPVGILLRCFYFTRGPGALFIALGVGMYFLFPVFFVLLDPGFVAAPPAPQGPPAPYQPYCYATMTTAVSVITSLEASGLGSTSGISLETARSDLAASYVSLMLHPLVALFLTLVFVRYMMTVLGGDTYELTKMVTKVI